MNYNIELIELVSKLAPIQQQLGFVKDGDSVILRAKEVATKIAYKLVAPVGYFDYPGQNLSFYEYKRFMSFFNIFNNPNKDASLSDQPILDANLTESGEVYDLIIKSSKGKQQFTYRAAIPGSIEEPNFNGVNLPSVDATLSLSEAQVEHLQKMIKLIQNGDDKSGIKINAVNDILKVSFINMATSDSYEIEYKLDSPVSEEFKFVADKDSIMLLPPANYSLSICSRGLIVFHMDREDAIDLNLYVSKQKITALSRG